MEWRVRGLVGLVVMVVVLPSPFSGSGIGATFLVCSMLAWSSVAFPSVGVLRPCSLDHSTYISRRAVDGVLARLNGAVV